MLRNCTWVLLLLLLPAAAEADVAEESKRFEEVAQRIVQAINAQDFPAIQREFNRQMSEAMPLEESSRFFSGLVNHFGKIETLESPRLAAPDRAEILAHATRSDLEFTKITVTGDGKS
jgi:hypothetical protein